MQRIGVFNTAFLGDAILTLPLVQSLALAYPNAAIDFYVRGGIAPLFQTHPALSEVIAYDKRGRQKGITGMLRLGNAVKNKKYDLWIGSHLSLRSSFLAWATHAPVRIGYEEAAMGTCCYTAQVGRQFGSLHEVERLLLLLQPLGLVPQSDWPDIVLPEENRREAHEVFTAFSSPVLGIHPGSTWPTKCWPVASFARIASQAIHEGMHVMLFAGKDEIVKAKELESMVLEQVSGEEAERFFHSMAGRLNLVQLAAYIARVSAYLTNDSGPMHLAWAQRVPLVALFGPTDASLGFTPRGAASHVMGLSLPCRPCGLHGAVRCPEKHHHCMTQISPDMVWEQLLPLLKAKTPYRGHI